MAPVQAQVRTENKSSWERGAFLAYLAVVGLLPFRFGSFKVAGLGVTLTDIAFVVAASMWLGGWLFDGLKIRKAGIYWPLLAYAFAMAVSIIGSVEPKRSVVKFIGELYLLGLAFLSVNLVTSEARFWRACRVWLSVTALTVVACLVGIALFYFGVRDRSVNLVLWAYGSVPPGNYPRLYGFFSNGNMLCNYLIVSVMLALAAHQQALISRLALSLLLGAVGITALFTMSTGIGGIALAAGLWLALVTRGGRNAAMGRLALAGSVIAGAILLAATTVSLTHPAQAGPRLLLWVNSAQTFFRYPLFGKGVGTDAAYVTWVNPSGIEEHLKEAHNVFLSVAAQLGIVGLLAFLWLLGYLLKGWRVHPRVPWTRALGCALIGSILYQGLTGAFEDARHVWVLIGLLATTFEDSGAEVKAGSTDDSVAHNAGQVWSTTD